MAALLLMRLCVNRRLFARKDAKK